MAWSLIDRPKTMKINKTLAEKYAEMEPAPHDRPLSERRLQIYERLFREGQFRPVTWASAYCKETGGLYRVNGKHTSILLANMTDLPEFYVTVESYECDTLADVAALYATFDSRTQSRTAQDIYRSFAGTSSKLASISSRVISCCASGFNMWENRSGYEVKYHGDAVEKAERLLEHEEVVVWVNDLLSCEREKMGGACTKIGRLESKHLARAPVVGAMFGTYLKYLKGATEFWTLVRDESGPINTTPDRKLARYLHQINVKSGGVILGANPKGTRAEPREVIVKCIHAWNAWRGDQSTELRYYPNADIPDLK
jgi:hypothetical protein